MSDSPIPGVSAEQVAALFAAFMTEKLAEAAKPKAVFRDLWAAYGRYGSARTDGGRTRIRSWDGYITAAKRLLPFFGDLPWDQVTLMKAEEYRALAKTWIVKKTGKPYKAATLNRHLRAVQSCLSWSLKRGLIPMHPLSTMEDEPMQNDRGFAITQEQFIELLKASRPQLRQMLILYYETGCRRDEIRTLEWLDVDLEAGFLTIPKEKAKNGKAREIALTVAARMVLDMIPRDPVNPFVFANPYAPTGPVSRTTQHGWLKRARADAKVTGPKGQPLWLHTLRHTWATDGLTSGIDVDTMMSMGGWGDLKTMRIYANISRRHREAAKKTMSARSVGLEGMLRKPASPAPTKRAAPKRAEVPEEPTDVLEEESGEG